MSEFVDITPSNAKNYQAPKDYKALQLWARILWVVGWINIVLGALCFIVGTILVLTVIGLPFGIGFITSGIVFVWTGVWTLAGSQVLHCIRDMAVNSFHQRHYLLVSIVQPSFRAPPANFMNTSRHDTDARIAVQRQPVGGGGGTIASKTTPPAAVMENRGENTIGVVKSTGLGSGRSWL